jgi:bacterioferritin-associated ferredoxin
MIRIDRCVCFDQNFADLKAVADSTGSRSVADLQEHVEFGSNCGLCRPYVSRMLTTGETVFSEILVEGADQESGSNDAA